MCRDLGLDSPWSLPVCWVGTRWSFGCCLCFFVAFAALPLRLGVCVVVGSSVRPGAVVWVRGVSASRVGLVLARQRGFAAVRVRVGRCVRCSLPWAAVSSLLVAPVC